jgi:hypothetical protein
MPEYRRTCSECDTLLDRPNQKTCGPSHRAKRSRRLKRSRKAAANAANTMPEHQRQVANATRDEARDIATELTREALQPVVREALTEDVLRSLRTMVGLAPQAVAALEQDLADPDAKIRQKAYQLWLQYTVGHGAILRPEPDEAAKGMVVHFNLPRPTDEPGTEAREDGPLVDATELRTCVMCGEDKPVAVRRRVGSLHACHEKLQAHARELLAS